MKRVSNEKITKVSPTLIQSLQPYPKNLLKLGTLSLNLLLEGTLLDLLYQFLNIKIYALFELV